MRKLERYRPLDISEVAAIEQVPYQRFTLARGRELIKAGQAPDSAFVLLEGWTAQSVLTFEGRRQIVSIAVPGDIIGRGAIRLGKADYSAVPLSRATFAAVDAARLSGLAANMPDLGRRLERMEAEHERHLRYQTLRLGRLTAEKRVAHFLCEMSDRVGNAGAEDGADWMSFPMTQTDISDALGLSLVHTNRQLQALRRQGLITLSRDRLRIENRRDLCEIGEYTAA